MFEFATQPDIVRSVQKDEHTLQQLRDTLYTVAQYIIGVNRITQYDNEIDLLSNSIYYTVTTLLNKKTLGEEYCDLQQVHVLKDQNNNIMQNSHTTNTINSTVSFNNQSIDKPVHRSTSTSTSATPTTTITNSRIKLLNTRNRVLLLCLQIITPYIYIKLRKRSRAVTTDQVQNPLIKLLYRIYNKLLDLVVNSDNWLYNLSKLHLAIFYITGNYMDIYKRICGVRYIMIRQIDIERPSYALLGIIILTQLALQGIYYTVQTTVQCIQQWRMHNNQQHSDNNIIHQYNDDSTLQQYNRTDIHRVDEYSDSDTESATCALCLSPRDHTSTSTECGHLFHWSCIAEAVTNIPACPLCRQPCVPQQLIMLAHYI